MIDQRLRELGSTLPAVFPPAGNYLGCVVDNGIVYVGGLRAHRRENIIRGKVGQDLTLVGGMRAPSGSAGGRFPSFTAGSSSWFCSPSPGGP